jgi:patched 1 protein/patched 2 protein
MVVVSLSILAGFGLTAAVGIKFTPLAGSVVPFLALGLGIDDIFVLVTILRSHLTNPQLESLNRGGSSKPEIEMKLTVALAGPSLVLTTFSILASFFISSVNPMLIVRWFCWQMGITASIHTCGMLLIFIPLMSIDARRVKAGIVDPFLWLFCGLRRQKGVHNDDIQDDPTMQGPKSYKDEANLTFEFEQNKGSSRLSRFIANYYAPLFHSNTFKFGVVIIFAGLLGSMIYLGTRVEHGLKISEVTVKGIKYFVQLSQYDFIHPNQDTSLPTLKFNLKKV